MTFAHFNCVVLLVLAVTFGHVFGAPCPPVSDCLWDNSGPGGSPLAPFSIFVEGDPCACADACLATATCNSFQVVFGFICALFDVPHGSPPTSSPGTAFQCGVACQTACGDPHFTGLNGVHYSFQGEKDKVFSLISAPSIELNSRFIRPSWESVETATYFGEMCLRTCNDTIRISPVNGLTLNGRPVTTPDYRTLREAPSPNVFVWPMNNATFKIVIPNKWEITVQLMNAGYINLPKVIALPGATADNSRPAHGILGHTLGAPVEQRHAGCNSASEGGCAVEGDWHNYEIAQDDVCGSSFKYSKYSCDA